MACGGRVAAVVVLLLLLVREGWGAPRRLVREEGGRILVIISVVGWVDGRVVPMSWMELVCGVVGWAVAVGRRMRALR